MPVYPLLEGVCCCLAALAGNIVPQRLWEGILLLKSRALTTREIIAVFHRAGLTAMQESL
jgi:hypothetical protein